MTAQLNQTLTIASGAQLPIESNMISPALTQPTALDTSDQNGAPSGYGSGLGHEVTTAYEMTSAHELYAPLTGDTTAGSNVIQNVVDNSPAGTPYAVGFAVDGPGIPAGAIITAVSGSTITLSQAALVTATGSSFDSWNEWTSAIDPNTIAAGGSGYTNGETVVALGGVTAAAGAPLLGTVTVSGGVVTGFTASDATNNGFQGAAADSANWYSVLPTVPCPVTGGSGTGDPLFNLTMNDVLSTTQPTGIGIATVVSGHGGSGYQVGDVLTVSAPDGITPVGTAATLTVTAVDGSGAILAVNVTTAGRYTKDNPATLFYVAPLPGGSSGTGCILSWQALQTSVPDNASSNLSVDAAIVNGGGYAVGDVLVVTGGSWKDALNNTVTWSVAPILQVTHYTYSSNGASFTYNLINTPVPSIAGEYPPSSVTFNVFPLGYTPSTTVVGPNNFYGAGVNGGVAEFTAGATVNFGPQVFGATPGSVIQQGAGTTVLTAADTYTGATAVNAGKLFVDGSITSSTTVAASATVGGTGTISAPVAVTGALIAGDATVASTGSFTVGNLSFGSGGTLNVLLNGTTAGSGYDQLSVTNVDLTGAALAVTLGSGFDPAIGTTFEIISNTGGSVTSTFTGLPEGSVAMIGGLPFTISYVGGDGNDVTLTRTSATVASDPVGPVALGTPVTFTATIANASSANTGTVSFYFDYGLADQFQIGGAVNLTGGSATSDSTTALPAGSDTITAIYTAGDGSVGVLGSVTIQVTSSTSAPTITDVAINQDISALYNAAGQPFAGAQRSMVNDIVYTFSADVNIAGSDAFTVAVASGWTGTVPTVSWAPITADNSEWAVTFSGGSVSGGSIANGAYTITINPADVTAVSDSQVLTVTPGTGNPDYATQKFFRLFGDINGDEFVNAADNAKFKNGLTTYNAAFDFNGDGFVNAFDNGKFKNPTVNFSGFTPTI